MFRGPVSALEELSLQILILVLIWVFVHRHSFACFRPQKYLSLVNGSTSGYYANGFFVCRFTRHTYPPASNAARSRGGKAGDQVFYPGTDLYHLMIAKGPVSSGRLTGVIDITSNNIKIENN